MADPVITITEMGGNCPVQAEGTIGDVPYYFRARGEHWSLGVGADAIGDPDWYLSARWTHEPFAAGWMTHTEAIRLLHLAIKMYLESRECLPKTSSSTSPSTPLPVIESGPKH